MSPKQSRRAFLGSLGAAAVGATAGCSAVLPGEQGNDRPARPTRAAAQDPPESDDSAYTEVYRQIVDSVARLDVYAGRGRSQGSAFVYDEGHLLTNHHVVADADAVDVQYADDDWTGADVVATDPHTDLGVVEVEDRPEYATPLALSEREPVVGEEVLALGNPLGFDSSLTTGVVSGTNRSLPSPTGYSIPNAIQTDAPLNPGNSGGPLVGLDAAVLGVANAGGGDNLGFGISAAVVRRVVPELLEEGEVAHSRMGIATYPVDRRVADANDLETVRGVLVAEVDEGGPAAGTLEPATETVRTGSRRVPAGGDVIVAVDGESIPSRNVLATHLLLETRPGDEVEVTVVREGEERTVEFELGRRDD